MLTCVPRAAVVAAALSMTMAAGAAAQPHSYSATASAKTAAGATITVPVVVTITRWTTDAERQKAIDTLKAGGTAALKTLLGTMSDAGTILVGERRTSVKFARSLPTGGSELVTVIAAEPIVHLGAGVADAKPKAGYDLSLMTFDIGSSGKGTFGELAPAAKVKLNADGAIVVEDYGAEVVRLTNIARK